MCLLTVDKAVEKIGAYFSKLKCTQKYVPRINDMQYPYIYMILKESECHHESLIDGAHPGPKTDIDYLGRYCMSEDL